MVTTNCDELTEGKIHCKVPLQGNTVEELKASAMQHALKEHAFILKMLSSKQRTQAEQRIEEVFQQKSNPMAVEPPSGTAGLPG